MKKIIKDVVYEKNGKRINIRKKDGTAFKNEQKAEIYKYYPLNEYSVSSLIENYLYAASPEEENDIFDSSPLLIDILTSDGLKQLLGIKELTPKEFVQRKLTEYISRDYGIISMTKRYKNKLMWSHYTRNNGFCVTFNQNNLRLDGAIGPFPVQYLRNPIESIVVNKGEECFIPLIPCFQKFWNWKYEEEWRYVIAKKKNGNSPKCRYSPNAIMAIHLGFYFFGQKETTNKRNIDNYCFRQKNDDDNVVLLKNILLRFIKERNIQLFIHMPLKTDILKFYEYEIVDIDSVNNMVTLKRSRIHNK